MCRILLVDDDELFRPMVEDALAHLGHQVVIARSGQEALTRYAEQPVDVVITDIVMPDKDGLETIRELRQITPGLSVIAMSGGGRGSANDYLHCAKCFGATALLEKPFSIQDLVGVIDAIAPWSGPPAE
jgi:CheY-like chemotaxis protein